MRAVYQARIALMFGAGLLLLGTLKLVFGTGEGAAPFLGAGVFVFGVGGVLRLWMRRQWLAADGTASTGIAAARGRLLNGPLGGFWAFWLGVSRDGVQRD